MTNRAEASTAVKTILKILDTGFDVSFVFLPAMGYVHQFMKIRNLKSSYGFSKLISFILIVAFIFRVFFWIGKRFEIVILFQSIVGIIMQLILLNECIKYTSEYKDKTNSDLFDHREFWNWPYFLDYFYFSTFLFIFLSLLSNLIGYDNLTYVEFLGGVSALVEAFLGVPQIYENYKSKNIKSLSFLMIGSWLLGDAIKFFFYIKSGSPAQLVLCAVMQFMGDLVIIGQIFYYKNYYNKLIEEPQIYNHVGIKNKQDII